MMCCSSQARKKKKNSIRYIVEGELISLCNVLVENVADNTEEVDNVFRVMESSGQKTCKRITFCTQNKSDKIEWITYLQEQIEELSKSLVVHNNSSNNSSSVVGSVSIKGGDDSSDSVSSTPEGLRWSRGSRKYNTEQSEGKNIKNWFESKYKKSSEDEQVKEISFFSLIFIFFFNFYFILIFIILFLFLLFLFKKREYLIPMKNN